MNRQTLDQIRALKAALPDTLSAMTVNKVCGSGLAASMLAARSIKAGDNQLVINGTGYLVIAGVAPEVDIGGAASPFFAQAIPASCTPVTAT